MTVPTAILNSFPEEHATGAEDWRVRRLAEYIEAHWNEAITHEDLAKELGPNSHLVFRNFEKSRGCTPKGYARAIRLKAAMKMLSSPGPDTSVKEVFARCGFGRFNYFVKSYLDIYGERPSETLARSTARLQADGDMAN